MSKKRCECSHYFDNQAEDLQTGICLADKCILNEPKYVTQAEAEKIGFELQQKWKSEKFFPPSMAVFFVLRKFNIRRLEGDLD